MFAGISRVLIPNIGTVLKKKPFLVSIWRVYFSTIPKTLHPGSRLMVLCTWHTPGLGEQSDGENPLQFLVFSSDA